MPKVKAKGLKALKGERKEKLTHNACRMRACIWCGKSRDPSALQNISQKNLERIKRYGSPSLDPASDDRLPKAICTSCRLGLGDLESPNKVGRKHLLPPLFDYE